MDMALPQKAKKNTLKSVFNKQNERMEITQEDRELLQALETVKKNLETVYINFEYATDTALIDSYIYEVKALQLKYEYIIKEIKQRGIQLVYPHN
jgi:hypothetical protein